MFEVMRKTRKTLLTNINEPCLELSKTLAHDEGEITVDEEIRNYQFPNISHYKIFSKLIIVRPIALAFQPAFANLDLRRRCTGDLDESEVRKVT